ncbi:MAG: hypothetical protein SAL07_09235 [Oscillatoria sp. PMC 1051.18]|nr:hypothetical protein [Oscillatoria sp. PMC 1050.18]MEC5030084.1 hypothetical protein [Oscillatoria sp. PMC 1051.18]
MGGIAKMRQAIKKIESNLIDRKNMIKRKIKAKLFKSIAIVLIAILSIIATNLTINIQPAQAETGNNFLAYNINKEIDQERKQETEKRYGEDAGDVVNQARQHNKEDSNSGLKIKPEDSLPEKASKFFNQVKDKGLVDKETQS